MQTVRAAFTSPRRNLQSKGKRTSDDQSVDGTVLTLATERSLASGESSIITRRINMMSEEFGSFNLSPNKERMSEEFDSFNLRPNKERTTNVAVEELTMNKLRYSSVGLYGRAKESAILKECLDRLTSDGKKGRELVMISGYSGTGKTYLALSLADQVKKLKGIIVSGKFDLNNRDEPYSGVAAACQDIIGQILMIRDDPSISDHSFEEIQSKIIAEFGVEIHLLTNVVPDLFEIIRDQEVAEADTRNQGSLDAQNQQIHYAFRLLLRIVSSFFAPLVIVLDDLQWADIASLDLLQVLMTDRENPNLMMIGCFRSSEVDEDHVLSETMRDLQDKSKRDGFCITEIGIENLDVPEVNQIIMALLSIDDESCTLDLAEICHKRTKGNAFFLIVFVTMIQNEGLLNFNLGLFQWKWDVSAIELKTTSTANVVDMMKEKMNKLSDQVVQLLQLAACLGATFDERVINLVWHKHLGDGTKPQDTGAFKILLEQVVEENFFEKVGTSRYCWVHDKVQEAAMSLIPADKLASLQFEVGMSLLRELDEKDLEAAIFVVVNLLNNPFGSMPLENSMGAEIAELSLLAAKKAKGGSAFVSAANYAASGISLLPEGKWKSHYKLTLELYSIGAEAEGIRGKIDETKAYCDEVLNQEGCSIFDKLRLYYALMDTMANGNRAQEALELCLDVLEQLQCKFPKKASAQAFRAIFTILKITREKYIPTVEEMNNLPMVTDAEKAEVMKLLNLLTTYCYYTKNMLLFVLVFTKMFHWTMRYGISDYSPQAMNGYGIIFNGVLGDLQGGTKLGDYALLMLDKLSTNVTVSRTYQATYTFLMPWTKPLRSSLNPYLEGYKVGMQVGDTESATWCLHFYLGALLVVGKSLKAIEADCRIYLPQMEELKRKVAAESTRLILQTVLNLMGLSSNVLLFTGEVMDEVQCVEEARAIKNDTYLNSVDFFKTYLYAYLGEHELGAKLALSKGDKYLKETPGFFFCMPEAFCRGISLYAMARKTKKRKYKKHAKRVKKTIKSWIDKGNPNVIHYACLLDAEQAALDGKKQLASTLFSKAVTLATRGGFLHDAGLANERYAVFLLDDCSDFEEGGYRMGESIRCYSEWGATIKVKRLREAYKDLLPGCIYIYHENSGVPCRPTRGSGALTISGPLTSSGHMV